MEGWWGGRGARARREEGGAVQGRVLEAAEEREGPLGNTCNARVVLLLIWPGEHAQLYGGKTCTPPPSPPRPDPLAAVPPCKRWPPPQRDNRQMFILAPVSAEKYNTVDRSRSQVQGFHAHMRESGVRTVPPRQATPVQTFLCSLCPRNWAARPRGRALDSSIKLSLHLAARMRGLTPYCPLRPLRPLIRRRWASPHPTGS